MRARHVWLPVVVACAGLSTGVVHAQLVGVTFEQSNLQLDTFTLNNSDWGSAEVEFIGSASTMYFNAEVDGVWRVQDMPVVSVLGPGMQQKMTFNFSLGSVGPHPNAFTRYSLTPAPLGAAPTANPGVVNLQPRQVTMSGGEGGFSLPYASAAGALIGGLVPFLPIPNGKYATYPNQECGVDECVPAAV